MNLPFHTFVIFCRSSYDSSDANNSSAVEVIYPFRTDTLLACQFQIEDEECM